MAEQAMYAPKADDNPWRVDDMKTPEEWLEFSLWYPFSVRSLIFDGRRYEDARCSSRDKAYHVMKCLAGGRSSPQLLYCGTVLSLWQRGTRKGDSVLSK